MDKLMRQRVLTTILVPVIFLILFIQISALSWHLYFYFWWLDIPVHILGGLWIATVGLTAYYHSSHPKEKEHSHTITVALAVATTLTIGLFWEIYEFGIEQAVGDTGAGLADTLQDLANDLVGAVLAAWIFMRFGYNKKQ